MSPPRVSATSLPLVIFGAPLPILTTRRAPNPWGKKRDASTMYDLSVGGHWLDATVANILDIYEEE